MAQDEKIWHPRFIQYIKKIINHPNYKGLPIKKNGNIPKSDFSLPTYRNAIRRVSSHIFRSKNL